MKKKYLIIIFLIFIRCQIPPKMSQENCDHLYQQAYTLLTDCVTEGKDSLKIARAEILLDSISIKDCPKMAYKVRNARIGIYTLKGKYEEAVEYIKKIPQNNFREAFIKDMCINIILAYNYKLKKDSRWVTHYKKAILPRITCLLKNPSDANALYDLYYFKTIFEGKKTILKELEEKINTDSLNKDTYKNMYDLFYTIGEQLIIIP